MKKVLIIDGDPVVAQLYRSSLEKQGYAAETCGDGQHGMERVQAFRPDAILLELMLAKLSGLELLKRVRALDGFASVPLVVLTNAYLPDMIQAALAAGASKVFEKSNNTPGHIISVLDQLLQVFRMAAPPPPPPRLLTPQIPRDHPGSPPPPANYGYNADERASPPSGTQAPTVEVDTSAFEEVRKAFVETNAESLAELRKLVQQVIPGDGLHNVVRRANSHAETPRVLALLIGIHKRTGNE